MNILVSVLLVFQLSWAAWWLVTSIVMHSEIRRALLSGKFNRQSFWGKLVILFIPQAGVLGTATTAIHYLVSALGY